MFTKERATKAYGVADIGKIETGVNVTMNQLWVSEEVTW
jgi:hypothetical protein